MIRSRSVRMVMVICRRRPQRVGEESSLFVFPFPISPILRLRQTELRHNPTPFSFQGPLGDAPTPQCPGGSAVPREVSASHFQRIQLAAVDPLSHSFSTTWRHERQHLFLLQLTVSDVFSGLGCLWEIRKNYIATIKCTT